MSEYVPLKYYFDAQLAKRLSSLIEAHDSTFPSDSFIHHVSKRVENKELKARVEVIADELHSHLPLDYEQALLILLNILGPENDTEEGMFTNGYFLMPVATFVEKYGQDHFDTSMNAMYEITKRHTSEYAIRPYLARDINRCLAYFQEWKSDSNSHVRRLVSEGTRPRLPWAKKIEPIKNDPRQNLTLIKGLINDPSPYVQKSVANHINDLTKDYSMIVLSWLSEYMDQNNNINSKVIKHGLRTLLKQKDSKAEELVHVINNR
ncbi:hypothetical protein GMD78_18235 [Ornithinibacillus sp. L9]|uniref:DNA alkylation repair protein n=1 Tax=Ornithinibacillus caprae TaxID=2678566 RepID=A0A6N8FLG9_9BACI|nr:DNA alkylation repair protein [Ornithinibacillus caprae]MUK90315.1 hypothetical protein [Ornithinibacillus caprae]